MTAGAEETLRVLTARAREWPVPDLQVSVVHGGDVVFSGTFTTADEATSTEDTLFHHGSCAKAYTSLLAVVLAVEGKIDVDARIRQYLPELRTADPGVTDRITMRDLLAHRSGLADLGDTKLKTTHRHFDTWDLRYEPLSIDFPLTFVTDSEGKVAEAVVPFDAASPPIRFRRDP